MEPSSDLDPMDSACSGVVIAIQLAKSAGAGFSQRIHDNRQNSRPSKDRVIITRLNLGYTYAPAEALLGVQHYAQWQEQEYRPDPPWRDSLISRLFEACGNSAWIVSKYAN